MQGVVSSLETTVEILKADSGLDRNRAEFLAAMESDKVGSETVLRIRIWIRICWSFWASWIRIRILLSPNKNSKKNLDSYCFVTSF
jgi:hypothetical protein